MQIILLPGLWLGAEVWSDVVGELGRRGFQAHAVALPGQGGGGQPTLQGQLDAVLRVVDGSEAPVVVVGHSAASALAWLVADRRPEVVSAVLMVGGFPAADGARYAAFFEPDPDGLVQFPGWEPFAGPDSADLSDAARAALEAGAHPMPSPVTHAQVEYTSRRRFTVPVVLVCPEYSPDDARAWLEAGDLPELEDAQSVEFADIDSGHWPMITKPAELAAVIAEQARLAAAR